MFSLNHNILNRMVIRKVLIPGFEKGPGIINPSYTVCKMTSTSVNKNSEQYVIFRRSHDVPLTRFGSKHRDIHSISLQNESAFFWTRPNF